MSTKEWARNNLPVWHLIFGLSLPVLQSKNTHFSPARAAFFLGKLLLRCPTSCIHAVVNQNEQIQTKSKPQPRKLFRAHP